MTIGEKLRKIRTALGLTQKQVAIMSKISEPAIRNYELNNRIPSESQKEKIALAIGVKPQAISDPNYDTYLNVMFALFALEDEYGIRAEKYEGRYVIAFPRDSSNDRGFRGHFSAWAEEYKKLADGEISKEDYDMWRWSYPSMESDRTAEMLRKIRAEKKNKNGDN